MASQQVSTRSQRQARRSFLASALCIESGEHHPDAADGPCLLPESCWQSVAAAAETWFIDMVVPAQKTLMVASLDGAEHALLDSGSGLTSCPLTGVNIEVRHAKNESSMIMDRSGTRTSVVLHKFAKVLLLKLRRRNSVLDHGCQHKTNGNRGN